MRSRCLCERPNERTQETGQDRSERDEEMMTMATLTSKTAVAVKTRATAVSCRRVRSRENGRTYSATTSTMLNRSRRCEVRAMAEEGESDTVSGGKDSKFPARNTVTGGWVGGEKGVKQFAADGENSASLDPNGFAGFLVGFAFLATAGTIIFVASKFAQLE